MKQGINYCYEMERQREILHREFNELGYAELAEQALMIEGYGELIKLTQKLYRLAQECGRQDIANEMFFEAWIYT